MPVSRPISQDTPQTSAGSIPRSEKEAILIEMLLSGLDLRASAAQAGSPMLTYLVDLLVMRAREELHAIAVNEPTSPRAPTMSEEVA